MAYKFQFGTARLSGALHQEGNVLVETGSSDVIGVVPEFGSTDYMAQMKYDGLADSGILELVSGSGDTSFYAGEKLSGSALNTLAGAALDFNQSTGIMDVTNVGIAGLVDDTAADVTADSMVFFDASDNTLKREELTDYAAAIAANGLADSNGTISVVNATNGGLQINANDMQLDIQDLSIQTISVSADSFAFVDGSGNTKRDSIDSLATAMVAGNNGLSATNGVFKVETSGAVRLDGDKVGITGSIAGAGLTFAGGVDSISSLSLDLDELSAAAIDVAADSFSFIDASDSSTKKESYADYATAAAGDGIAANSGQFDLDLNELTAATVDVAADSIAIVDANDSNASRKESIADLVSAMAGAGLAASSGVLSVQSNNVSTFTGGGALAEGFNIATANFSTSIAMTLPASPDVGDVVRIKAQDLTAGAVIQIRKDGATSHTIDGEGSIEIESPYGAVSCVYVATNDWRVF